MNFEDKKIGELRQMTEDYERLQKENLFMKVKYPKAKEELESNNVDDLINSLDTEIKRPKFQ
jgi:hypothetical protein